MQMTGIKRNKREWMRKQLVDRTFLLFICLSVFRLFAFFTFFDFGSLQLWTNLFMGALSLLMVVLSIPDMSKGLQILWLGLFGALSISYLTHFTGLEYACNTVVFLAEYNCRIFL